MKILVYFYYFLRSILLRGPIASWLLLRDEMRYEKKFGIKTSAIKRSESPEFFHYQGAGYRVLLRLFKEVSVETKKYDFVDIGCGKGRAIFVAEYCGYDRLTGIEFDNDLVNMAKQNLKLYSLKRKDTAIEFIHANALDYTYKNTATVYFLFNPFNEEIMREVLNRICSQSHSETWFIYMNPLYRKPFEEKQMMRVKEFKTGFYLEAVVYKINAGTKKMD